MGQYENQWWSCCFGHRGKCFFNPAIVPATQGIDIRFPETRFNRLKQKRKIMKPKQNLIQIWLLDAMLPAVSLLLLVPTVTAQQWTTNDLPSGLIGWWQAENNYADTVGGNDLTPDGGVTFAPGRFGQAFQFDGVSGSAYCSGAAALNGWTQFTLEAWINLDNTNDSVGGDGIISRVGNAVNHQDNHGYQFGIGGNSTRLLCQFNTDGQNWPVNQTIAPFPQPLVTGVWYHVAATYDHNATVLYFNGSPLVTNVVGPVTIATSTSLFRISKDDNSNVPFPGRIDDARIYNHALSAAEIAYLYAGPPGYNQISIQLLSGGSVLLSYVGMAGTNYALDNTFNLSPPVNWLPLVTNPADADGVLVFTNTPNPTTNNFWRIRSVP
jgi:hypothetical protein